ncbi:MAG: hypothetical protein M4D80_27865 [Myxococcota bacterium]|nr:hypothetical protein [Myxococcota bacterium]
MSNIDKTIARDLAALGENSRRDVPALAPALDALRTKDAYRDDQPGAEARRNALAEERRRELVLMPLTLAHVFAHRVGRAAAGGMALLVSVVMFALIADPLLMRFAAWVVPGLNVGFLVLISALAVVGSYVVATWIAEIWFERRMRQAIATSKDAYNDIEQLAQGPLEIAQRAVARVDGWSFGLFLAGASSAVLVFGYTAVIVGSNHTLSHAWSMIGIADSGALTRNVGFLMPGLVASGVIAILLGRACDRDRISTSAIARAFGSWIVLAVAGVFGIAMLYKTFHLMADFHPARRLGGDERMFMSVATSIVVFAPLAWGSLFWRRREKARVDR